MVSNKLNPRALGESLELWALRREKVLEVLDIKAAKKARGLAGMCRELSRVSMDNPSWDFQWMTIRAAAAALLERHRSVSGPPNGLAPASFYGPRTVPPVAEAPGAVSGTRLRADDMPNSERPTRVAQAMWFGPEAQNKVA